MSKQTETTKTTTLRAALKAIRSDLEGRDHLSGALYYQCDSGVLEVTNRASTDGQGTSYLLGLFVAQLMDSSGNVVKTYKV